MNEYLIAKLKEGRINKGLKQSDVTKCTGIKNTTLSNYENGITEPDIDTFLQLCEFYELDYAGILAEAYGLSVQGEDFKIKPSEIEYVKRYRFITEHSSDGAKVVDTVLEREYSIAEKLKEQSEQLQQMNMEISEEILPLRIISYYQKLASAGTGQVIFDDTAVDRIEIPDIPKYKRVSYAIGVNGHSMEPLYYDGDILLIEPTCEVEVGEIGIFIVDGQAYVKKLGIGELISLNKGYGNIPLTEYSNCMGRVVDKLQKDQAAIVL